MAISHHLIEYHLVRSLTIVCIVSLIVLSVYQLNATLELTKKMIEHIEKTDATFEKHAAKNRTMSTIMFEPLQRSAHAIYDKNESAILMNIIIFTSLIATSMAGLVVAIRKHLIMLIIYGITLDIIYMSSFLNCSRVPSFHCSFIVFTSIICFLRAHHLWLKQSESKVRLIQASSSDHEMMKNVV